MHWFEAKHLINSVLKFCTNKWEIWENRFDNVNWEFLSFFMGFGFHLVTVSILRDWRNIFYMSEEILTEEVHVWLWSSATRTKSVVVTHFWMKKQSLPWGMSATYNNIGNWHLILAPQFVVTGRPVKLWHQISRNASSVQSWRDCSSFDLKRTDFGWHNTWNGIRFVEFAGNHAKILFSFDLWILLHCADTWSILKWSG